MQIYNKNDTNARSDRHKYQLIGMKISARSRRPDGYSIYARRIGITFSDSLQLPYRGRRVIGTENCAAGNQDIDA